MGQPRKDLSKWFWNLLAPDLDFCCLNFKSGAAEDRNRFIPKPRKRSTPSPGVPSRQGEAAKAISNPRPGPAPRGRRTQRTNKAGYPSESRFSPIVPSGKHQPPLLGILNPLPLEKTFGAGGDAWRIKPGGSMGCRSPPTRALTSHSTSLAPRPLQPPAACWGPHRAPRDPLPARRRKAYSLSPPDGRQHCSTGSRRGSRDWGEGAPRWAHGRKGKDSSHLSGCSLVSSVARGGDVVGAESAKVENSKACADSHVAAGLGLALLF